MFVISCVPVCIIIVIYDVVCILLYILLSLLTLICLVLLFGYDSTLYSISFHVLLSSSIVSFNVPCYCYRWVSIHSLTFLRLASTGA
jgi:hypothetical protein